MARFGLEIVLGDDAAFEQFLAHARTDAVSQNGILAEGQVNVEDVVGGRERKCHQYSVVFGP